MAQTRRPARLVGSVHPGPWAPLRWPALLTVGVLVYGTGGYMLLEGWPFLDSLYMTLMTMTTVGFGEVRPLDASGKVLTMSLILLGVTILLLTLSIAAGVLLEDPIRERIRRRRMQRRTDGLRDHYIVCGFGRVGRTVVEELRAANAPFIVIDKSDGREKELMHEEVVYLIGDATNKEDLARAGVDRARALISVVDDDAQNIYITMVARSISRDIRIVARASDEESRDRLLTAGADRVYSPFVTAGREMAGAALNPNIVDFFEVETEGAPVLRLEELQIAHSSNLLGRPLSEARGRATALALRRADGTLLAPPDDSLTIELGDTLVLLVEREEARAVDAREARRPSPTA